MNERGDFLSTIQKTLIGGIGGLCLVLLKLIENKFFIDSSSPTIATISYLTYFTYILLGMIVAAFLTDHELPKEKCKRHALMMGLLAPSILLAIVSRPNDYHNFERKTLRDIPSISSLFFKDAYAKEPRALGSTKAVKAKKDIVINTIDVDKSTKDLVVALSKKDVEVSTLEALLFVLNRGRIDEKYTYAIGVSDDKNKAIGIAEGLNTIMKCTEQNSCVKVYTIKGSNKNIVSVGGLVSKYSAYTARKVSSGAVIQALEKNNDKKTAEIANLVANGEVISGLALFEK